MILPDDNPAQLSPALRQDIRRDLLARLLRYVTIDTTSYSQENDFPSSPGQLDMARLLRSELEALGLSAIREEGNGYVYARFPGRGSATGTALNLCAHLDTSEMACGQDVRPRCHADYQGEALLFPDAPELSLTPKDSPELLEYRSDTIITAAGKTLLGADDKAGIAEIMTLLYILRRCPDWPCPELRLVFTPEEETGRGTQQLDYSELAPAGFTLDIGRPGEINDSCFDAWRIDIGIQGQAAHPGYAPGQLRNAGRVAAFIAAHLPLDERPETTSGRAGYYHLSRLEGSESEAHVQILLRDFEERANQHRREYLHELITRAREFVPGIAIDLRATHMYPNMRRCTRRMEGLMTLAGEAFRRIGIEPQRRPIRGGTDGALMCCEGIAMANLGTGGMLPHSRKEWIALGAMEQTCWALLRLCALMAEDGNAEATPEEI